MGYMTSINHNKRRGSAHPAHTHTTHPPTPSPPTHTHPHFPHFPPTSLGSHHIPHISHIPYCAHPQLRDTHIESECSCMYVRSTHVRTGRGETRIYTGIHTIRRGEESEYSASPLLCSLHQSQISRRGSTGSTFFHPVPYYAIRLHRPTTTRTTSYSYVCSSMYVEWLGVVCKYSLYVCTYVRMYRTYTINCAHVV